MTAELAQDRTVIRVTGPENFKFLQDAVTNDLNRLDDGLVYTAVLTAQGKYLFDFFVLRDGDDLLIDIHAGQAVAFANRMTMFKLRAKLEFELIDLKVHRGLGDVPSDGYADPRHPALGWRRFSSEMSADPQIDWTDIRVEHCIPETGIELLADETYILEAGFERLNGVDFRKGCYIGQEVTARMKHKTELRKGYVTVGVEGAAEVGTAIRSDGKAVGFLYSQSNGKGIAYLRHDRAVGELTADRAILTLLK